MNVAREVEAALADVRFDKHQPATLGSFGIGTFPVDGDSVQSLFAAADARMYGEKHRRKAESLSTLAGAARKLFVRAGRAMRPEQTTAQILAEIAIAAREEFSLLLCGIAVDARDHHASLVAVASDDSDVQAAATRAFEGPSTDDELKSVLPSQTWRVDTPILDDSGDPTGTIVLAGMPNASFRPDASVVVALTDLIQAVVANGRAHLDAVRAGRERDIHVDLARALAGGGSLDSRLADVARLIADFVGAKAVAIQVLPGASGEGASYNEHVREAPFDRPDDYLKMAVSPEWADLVRGLAASPARRTRDPHEGSSMPTPIRDALIRNGVHSGAMCPIRFEGQSLGLLTATSKTPGYFTEEMLAVLVTIADHLAPAINVALLRDQLEASYEQLEQASRESLSRLADAAEARDPHTGGHLRRIACYSVALARELGLSEEEANAIGSASAVHDLGKLGLSDAVLLKPGKLTSDDWEKMREHPLHGERLIGDSPKFQMERVVARWHHERWDGTGYPDGLRGEAIPLAARIVAVADAFDALTTERPYKQAWSLEEAFREIESTKGTLFCPSVVSALHALWESGDLATILDSNVRNEALRDHDRMHQRAAA